VAAALERLPGVKSVKVSLEKAQARVEFDDAKISTDKLVGVIDLLGFRARLLDVKRLSWGGAGIHEYATGERTRSGRRARVKLRHYRTPQLLDTPGVSMVPISLMTFGRMLILVLLAALVVVPPVAMASDHCAGMSHTCEAPCGASPCAVFPPLPVSMAPELVASIEAQPPGHLPASLFALLEPPPKPFPLSA